MAIFGERLQKLREGHKWSRQELAECSDVPYMTIYRLEEGIYQEPRVSVAAKLARALGVSLDVLAGTYQEDLSERKPAGVALVEA